VLEQMIKTNAIIGGEDSGHMIFLDHHTSGDGIFTGLRLIQVMQDTAQPLSELVKIMKVFPQVLMNIKIREKINIDRIPEITEAINKVETCLKDQGRVLVRYSGTRPICRVMIEGPDKKDTRQYCRDIADVISAKIGIK
jgi:phosphoglucosamine mutase